MRKDKIADDALKQAYELYQFSERGFHGTGIDAEDVPVLAPQVSKLKKEDEPWQPNSAFYGNQPRGAGPKVYSYGEEQGTGEYNRMEAELTRLMDAQERLSGQLRRARQMGNFQEEHRIVQERNDVLKAISAVEARMAANDLGRFQRGMNDGMMYDSQNHKDEANPFQGFSEYLSKIEENDAKIARLEEALMSFAEGKNIKSTGGDSAADPGQSYDRADDEEDDEDEDEEELSTDHSTGAGGVDAKTAKEMADIYNNRKSNSKPGDKFDNQGNKQPVNPEPYKPSGKRNENQANQSQTKKKTCLKPGPNAKVCTRWSD